MGVCNSCDRENDHDARKAEDAAFERTLKQRANSSGKSFQPLPEQRSSCRFSETFRFDDCSREPEARPQSGVFKIPNDFFPTSPSRISKSEKRDIMDWGVCEVVNWWCEKLPDEAIQYAPLVEDTKLKGEDLVAMDLELLMSFQIDRPLAEHILKKIERLVHESTAHFRNLTGSTETTTSGNEPRDYTMTSTGETQVFSDQEGDSLPSYWRSPGLADETDDECARIQSPVMMIMVDDDDNNLNEAGLARNTTLPCANTLPNEPENIDSPPRSPLCLLPPNSPRMDQEVEEDRIAQLEKQIQALQDKLSNKKLQVFPAKHFKKPNVRSKSGSNGKEKSRGVAKGRRKNGKNQSKRKQGKFSVYKEGPTDIGRMENWSPARYDIEDDGRQFLDERLNVTNQRQKYHVYKQGPRDVGTVSTGWKPYKHTREDSGRDFLAPRITRTKPVARAPARKAGPRGRTEVTRKRSSLTKSSKRKESASRKNSCRNEKRNSLSRSSSGNRKSSSRRNSKSKNSCCANESDTRAVDLSTPQDANFTSGDFRLLKMSLNCGGEDSSLCESPRFE